MSRPFEILQIGFGTIGRPIAKVIIERENLVLSGVVDTDTKLREKTAEEVLTLETESTTSIHSSVEDALAKLDSIPDLALILTVSNLEGITPTIRECLEAGMDVLSICEELSYPYSKYPELSSQIDTAAREAGKTVVGTGINPGYLMDLLPIVITAPCQQVDSIHVTRVIDSGRRRASFQKKVGTGMSVEEFDNAIKEKRITGHVGLVESMQMISDALGLDLDHFEEFPPEAVIADETVTTSFATIEKGDVVGLKSRSIGAKGGNTFITLEFVANAAVEHEFDEIRVTGYPNLTQRIEGGVMGDYGTAAMAVNMVPLVINAEPGLFTMKDLPVPRNTQRVWKNE